MGSDEIRNPPLTPYHHHPRPTNLYSCYVDLLTSPCVHASLKSPALGEGVDDGFVGGASHGSDRRRYWSEITQVARVAGAERMDLLYSEGGGEFHLGVQVFLRHLA
jgi:hypothetical protein